MNEYEMNNQLDQKIRALQKELNQLKRTRRARKAKTRSGYSIGSMPIQG